MAGDLLPKPLLGVGPEAHLVERLFDRAGNLRPFEELARELGDMQAFLALFELELRNHLRRPRARGYPPRIFISYRRESPQDIAWCTRLYDALTANGYDAWLDETVLRPHLQDEGYFQDVARFMGNLGTSDVALVVLTEGFAGGGGAMRNWIFEEWSRIGTLDDWGLLEIVVVHRNGDLANLWGGIGARQAYIDNRSDPDSVDAPAAFFGRYGGRRLDSSDLQRLETRAAEAINASSSGDRVRAEHALEQIRDLSATEEYALAVAHVLARGGDRERARAVALTAIARNPTLPTASHLAQLLWICDYNDDAFPVLCAAAEGPSLWQQQMHFIMGDILEHAGLLVAAINQFTWCLAAHEGETAGNFWTKLPDDFLEMVYERLANLWNELGDPSVGATYAAGLISLRADPTPSEGKRRTVKRPPFSTTLFEGGASCARCQAVFPPRWTACVHCGTTRQAGAECGMCRGDPPLMQEPAALEFCPVCRKGMDSSGQWRNFHIFPREPKGQWSVLAT